MRTSSYILHYALLPICVSVLCGCGQVPAGESAGPAKSSQMITGSASTGFPSVVYFGNSTTGAPVCAGVVVKTDLVLTSATCAGETSGTVLYTSSGSGSTFVNSSITVSASNVTVIPAGTLLALLRFNVPINVTTFPSISPTVPSTVTAVGVNSSTRERNSIASLTAAQDPLFTNEYCIGDSTTPFESPSDEGMPLFASDGSVVGIADAVNHCMGGSLLDMIPAQGIPMPVTGKFADADPATSFLAFLDKNGPYHEVRVVVNKGVVTADTGIPVGMAQLHGTSVAPQLTVISNGDGTNSLKVAFDGGVVDPTSLGADDTSVADVSVPADSSGGSSHAAIRVDVGMSFILNGSDVFDTSGNLQPSWKGFPSAEPNDGRFLSLSGSGFSSTQVAKFTGFIDCPTSTPFKIQVFDPDTSGDFDGITTTAHTCIRLSVDPQKNGPGNDPTESATDVGCVKDATENVEFSNATANGLWYNFFDGAPSSCANNHPNTDVDSSGSRRTYRIEVFLTTAAKGAGVAVPANTLGSMPGVTNNFKIRTTCDLEATAQDVTVIANDLNPGVFSQMGTGINEVSVLDTTFNRSGTISYTIDTKGATALRLKNLDADDCDTGTCGSIGASRNIHFLALDSTGPRSILRLTNDTTVDPTWQLATPWTFATLGTGGKPLLQNQNPSGNYDGIPLPDVAEVGRFRVVTSATDKRLAVIWRDVRVENAFTLFQPNASPTVFPVLSNTSVWHPLLQAWTPASWVASPTDLAAQLPFEVGDPGGRHAATTLAQAQALLNPDDLTAKLAAATLNAKRVLSRGQHLESGVIRGTNILVSDAMADASHVLAGAAPTLPNLSELLDFVNSGLLLFNYVTPELPSTDDPDLDGIPTGSDNCPVVCNPGQEDTTMLDQWGDACDPTPSVDCVQKRSATKYTAYFGYTNPWRQWELTNNFNRFTTGAENRGQPTSFSVGRHHRVFSVDFDGTPLSWSLAGNVATASASSPACSGGEATNVRVNKNVALLASNGITLGDRVKMTQLDAIAAGSSGIVIGYDATVGDVSALGNLTTRDRVDVEGNIRVNGNIWYGAQNTINGLAIAHDGVQLDDIGLSVQSPSWRAPLAPIPNDGSRTVAPGNYQTLVVGDRATLRLTAGTYDFNALQINNDAHLIVDDSAGLVTIIVRYGFTYGNRASTTATGGGHPKLLLEYLGSNSISLTSSFAGSVIAPSANLSLTLQSTFVGTFFAKNIAVDNDVKITYAPLTPSADSSDVQVVVCEG